MKEVQLLKLRRTPTDEQTEGGKAQKPKGTKNNKVLHKSPSPKIENVINEKRMNSHELELNIELKQVSNKVYGKKEGKSGKEGGKVISNQSSLYVDEEEYAIKNASRLNKDDGTLSPHHQVIKVEYDDPPELQVKAKESKTKGAGKKQAGIGGEKKVVKKNL